MLRQLSTKAFGAILGSLLLFQQAQAVDYYDDSCCDTNCDYNSNYNCCGKFWGKADYLYWKIEDDRALIPFVVEGPFDPQAPIIFLGSPGSSVVLGGKKQNNEWRSGGKLAVGYWFDDCRTFGAELSYFGLPHDSKRHSVISEGEVNSPFLAVPFFDTTTGLESATLIAVPGVIAGTASLRLQNRMQGIEANAHLNFTFDCASRFGVLAGLRFWNFEDNLNFNTSSTFTNPLLLGNFFETKDKFRTRNNFYGFQLGADFEYKTGCFFFDVQGKIALGAMCQKSVIHGVLKTNDFRIPPFPLGVPFTFPGGYFALPSNIGSHTKTKFSWIPEINLNAGYQITDCISLEVGYTFFYVSEVARASRQVNRNLNPTQSIAIEFDPVLDPVLPLEPKGKIKSKGLWVQGVNVGLSYNF